ncbi:MAG: Helicase associated domain protein, partial [Humibacillus sp.]|nr:Helicase associated domain protein [Humibacillus sp.]
MSVPLLDPGRVAAITPRAPQLAAVAALTATFDRHPRAQERMACGVGKTYVSLLTAAAVQARTVVVAVPSRTLVDQTLRSWMPLLSKGAQTVAVCSADGLFTPAGPVAVGPRVTTTDPGRIGFLLEQDAPTLVVTTYHSLPRLAAAARETRTRLDLLVLDEAHHLTGHLSRGRRQALDDTTLPAARRLAMTATPQIATEADAAGASGFDPFTSPAASAAAVSMDDESLFGPVAHVYSTRQAIDDGYLCDYEVMVVSRVDTPINRERLPLAALAAAANDHGAARALSFHNWVPDARAFATLLNATSHEQVRFVADTITGTTPTSTRRKILTTLAGACAPGVVRVVTAARCLREGVDVCAVDAVLFAAPRSGTTDIVQAVGRALRVHPGKRRGTIILPLLLPAAGGTDDDEQLTSSQFAHIWKVLRALNAHDPRVSESLARHSGPARDEARRGSRVGERALPDWLHLVGNLDADTIMGRLITPDSTAWETMFAEVAQVVHEVGSAHRVKSSHVRAGRQVGAWVVTQRHNYRRGVISPARAERLEQLPGWTWRAEGLVDHRAIDRLEAIAAATGTCRDGATGESTYPSVPGQPRLGRWLAQTRRSYREHTLEKCLVVRLEQLPGWAWEPLATADRAGVEALKAFVAWEGTAAVPVGHREGEVALSAWLDRHGRAYLAKQLPPELHEEILAVCPTNSKGDPLFGWDVPRVRSDAALTALQQYVDAGGVITDMPATHQERVDELVINLYQWCARARWLARRGELHPALHTRLEQIPGWVWDLGRAKTRHDAPIDLPVGVPHGRARSRSYYGCPCRECDLAARSSQTAFKRHRVANLTAGWVPSPAGAVRVKSLMGAHRWMVPAGVAAAVGLPRTLLAELLADPQTTPVPPWAAARLEALTTGQVRPWHREGTRGRPTSCGSDPGDRAHHQQMLSQLRAAGWSDAQIAAALGYRGSAAHITRPDVSASVVHALTQLLRTLPPDRPVPSWVDTAA